MGYEILNSSVVTPPRLHAMVRLVSRLHNPTREDIYDLLQPTKLLSKLKDQNTANDVYTAARQSGLLLEDEAKIVRLQAEAQDVEQLADFRRAMQRKLLHITDDSSNNYLLNIFNAWYAVQEERIFQLTSKDFEIRFNDEIFPGSEGRDFNTTKYNGWRNWTVFLGLGWPMRFSGRDLVVPDANERLLPLLDELLPDGEKIVLFSTFMEQLAEYCPELDGGRLFERCWQASRGAEKRGNRLSLMLSNALRVLHDSGAIELVSQSDAPVRWQLYAAVGHPLHQVSHIRRGRAA
jgi:hypothetical protein